MIERDISAEVAELFAEEQTRVDVEWLEAVMVVRGRRNEREREEHIAYMRARRRLTRRPRGMTVFGRTQPLAAWAREFGHKDTTVRHRLMLGWSLEKALTERARRTIW